MTSSVVRIAMWSGPRNISTAMMRSFGNRKDTVAVDEPFYAHYLDQTGLEHPMRKEILKSQNLNADTVIADLLASLPAGKTVYYQKHMTHHMLPSVGRRWIKECQNCFLIRDPKAVIASYAAKHDRITEDDIGIRMQAELFDYVSAYQDNPPAVIDTTDILASPDTMLPKLCDHIGIAFNEHMLSWPKGRRTEDGIWAEHWYHSVEESTGFVNYVPKDIVLSAELQRLADRMQPLYDRLYALRLQP